MLEDATLQPVRADEIREAARCLHIWHRRNQGESLLAMAKQQGVSFETMQRWHLHGKAVATEELPLWLHVAETVRGYLEYFVAAQHSPREAVEHQSEWMANLVTFVGWSRRAPPPSVAAVLKQRYGLDLAAAPDANSRAEHHGRMVAALDLARAWRRESTAHAVAEPAASGF